MEAASPPLESTRVRCCIVGGGPAGMMLGFLLARAGVDLVVLEKHADFLRDFRGDTLHPSTLETMSELGLLEELLRRPHQKLSQIRARVSGLDLLVGDLSYLRTRCRFIALMPQWDFLDFLAEQGRRYPGFTLKMRTEATGLIEEEGRIAGIRGKTHAGPVEVRADLVVGADGRNSVVRECSGLPVLEVGMPNDMMWMRLSRRDDDPDLLVYSDRSRVLVLLNRGSYWQCGFPTPKGAIEQMHAEGMEAFRANIVALAPFLRDRVAELRNWDDVKTLTVRVNRLRQWYRPGLICIGDAAHAMSPVGGVGINLAIQDAIAAANILAEPLGHGAVRLDHLARIQRRREFPTRFTQGVQEWMRRQQVAGGRLGGPPKPLPWPVRLLERTTLPRRARTRFVGIGVRPEHVKTPDVFR